MNKYQAPHITAVLSLYVKTIAKMEVLKLWTLLFIYRHSTNHRLHYTEPELEYYKGTAKLI